MQENMELKFDLPFPFSSEPLSPLEQDILLGKQGALLASTTEKMLLEANCRLYEGHQPNPQATYAREMFKVALELCKKYNPRDVETGMRKYVPDLF